MSRRTADDDRMSMTSLSLQQRNVPDEIPIHLIMKTSVALVILRIICAENLLVSIYLVFALPSIPNRFSDEAWAVPQFRTQLEKGTASEFFLSAAQSNGSMRNTAMAHLFALGALAVITTILTGYAAYSLRTIGVKRSLVGTVIT